MPLLIPIKYGRREYPENIVLRIQEIAAHFDVKGIRPGMPYSLHTEYSYGKRKYSSEPVKNYSIIRESNLKSVPQLWRSGEWSREFSEFVISLVGEKRPPEIIEVHPPFVDYCDSIDQFLDLYGIFEKRIHQKFPDVKILIQNRYGTTYSGGRFLASTNEDFIELSKAIKRRKLRLGIVLDFPQLFSAHGIDTYKTSEQEIRDLIKPVYEYRDMIEGMHIWGKRLSDSGRPIAHVGNLDTYFNNERMKRFFLRELYDLFDDGKPRFFVPEVNSGNNDVASIIKDFIEAGFEFV